MNQKDALILFILGSLTFCIAFGISSPALLVNDEWITVNQVNQLATGTQIIESEGKYGRTYDGEESAYFRAKGSYLAYTLFLPILSLPAMFGILLVGDLFRLILLVLWFGLGIFALFASLHLLNKSGKNVLSVMIWVLIFIFFILFLINIFYYQPYESSFIDSPIESAAVILTNEILLAMMAPMIYAIFRNVSVPRKTSIIGAISVLCCSSYLIWSSSAKDHLLVAFLLTALILVFSSIIHRDSMIKWFLLFVISGLLCWARTEYGIIIGMGLIILMVIFLFIRKDEPKNLASNIFHMLIPGFIGMIIGLFPFLINNYLITGNPFIPPQYIYLTTGRGTLASILTTDNPGSMSISYSGFTFIHQAISFYSPNTENFLKDIIGIFLTPENNGVGILFICPIILPAILYAIVRYKAVSIQLSQKTSLMLYFSFFITFLTLLGYLRVLHGSIISSGSLPDMRYFSPIYLPLGIISILLLSPIININPDRWLRYLFITLFLGVPLLTIVSIMYLSHGISFEGYVNIHVRILFILLLLLFGIAAISKDFWNKNRLFPLFFSLLILIPSSFQFFFVLVNALAKINGYLYWQPFLQYLFTYVFLVMG
jgi:hypothetical protein